MDEIDYSLFVPNVHFEKIPICDLVSNQDYQRALSKDHILKTAENFDLYQINPAKVSRRDGLNYVFDGQHTIEVVALVSGSRETPVWCMVYDDMGYIKEADTFANQQKHVKRLSPYDVTLQICIIIYKLNSFVVSCANLPPDKGDVPCELDIFVSLVIHTVATVLAGNINEGNISLCNFYCGFLGANCAELRQPSVSESEIVSTH